MTVDWLYERAVCTGLGDRLGTIIALSALASLHNSSFIVHMEWCTDPMRVDPSHLVYIPKWTGWHYSLKELRKTITLPENIRLFLPGERPNAFHVGLVREQGVVPIWNGNMHTNTLYCQTLTMLSGRRQRTTRECETMYHWAGSKVQPVKQRAVGQAHVLVHFRSPDDNTCMHGRDEKPFCTPSVLRELHAAGLYMMVISNNHSFSMQWLRGLPSMHLVHASSPLQDMSLALSATAIVQHASEGWSSFTSVPAMARGIPLINTFEGSDHRFDLFRSHGQVPRELYTCEQLGAFVRDAVFSWRRTRNQN